jgi:hypothetical protein
MQRERLGEWSQLKQPPMTPAVSFKDGDAYAVEIVDYH